MKKRISRAFLYVLGAIGLLVYTLVMIEWAVDTTPKEGGFLGIAIHFVGLFLSFPVLFIFCAVIFILSTGYYRALGVSDSKTPPI